MPGLTGFTGTKKNTKNIYGHDAFMQWFCTRMNMFGGLM